MKKQTAVEWLMDKIEKNVHHTIRIPREIIEQAKAMEKEQIEDACNQTEFEDEEMFGISVVITKGELYYYETYEGGDK